MLFFNARLLRFGYILYLYFRCCLRFHILHRARHIRCGVCGGSSFGHTIKFIYISLFAFSPSNKIEWKIEMALYYIRMPKPMHCPTIANTSKLMKPIRSHTIATTTATKILINKNQIPCSVQNRLRAVLFIYLSSWKIKQMKAAKRKTNEWK